MKVKLRISETGVLFIQMALITYRVTDLEQVTNPIQQVVKAGHTIKQIIIQINNSQENN